MGDLFDFGAEPQDPAIEPTLWMKKGEVYKIIVAISEDKQTMVLEAPPEVWEYLRIADNSITELGTSREQESTPGLFLAGITYHASRNSYDNDYDEWTEIVSWEKLLCPTLETKEDTDGR